MTAGGKQKALKLLAQSERALSRGHFDDALALANEAKGACDGALPEVFAAEADAQLARGDAEGALRAAEAGLSRHKAKAELLARSGAALSSLGRIDEAIVRYEGAHATLKKDAPFLTNYGFSLLQAGRHGKAEEVLARAVTAGGGNPARLFRALALGKLGRFEEAAQLSEKLASNTLDEELGRAASSLRADCLLFLGEARAALAIWKALKQAGRLDASQLGHMAYAAELAGERPLADALMAERQSGEATAEDLLLFAQIMNTRGQPEAALERLAQSEAAVGSPGTELEFAL